MYISFIHHYIYIYNDMYIYIYIYDDDIYIYISYIYIIIIYIYQCIYICIKYHYIDINIIYIHIIYIYIYHCKYLPLYIYMYISDLLLDIIKYHYTSWYIRIWYIAKCHDISLSIRNIRFSYSMSLWLGRGRSPAWETLWGRANVGGTWSRWAVAVFKTPVGWWFNLNSLGCQPPKYVDIVGI